MKYYITLLVIIITLNGCSLIYSYDSNLVQRVQQWMNEEKYITAIETINRIPATHPHYHELQINKREILERLNKLEQQTIKDSRSLAKQGEWLLALKRIDETEVKLVNAKKLAEHKQKLLIQRNKLIRKYEHEHLNAQARYLSSRIAFYEKIRKTVDKKEDHEFNRVEFDKLCQETSARLLQQAEYQYKENKYAKALTTINLALSLNPDKATTSRLKTAKNLIQKLNKTKQQAHIVSAESLLISLSQRYSYALLKETKNKLDWFNQNKERKRAYRVVIKKLEAHLMLGTKHYFNMARKLYSIGEVEEALSIWLKLKEIVPNYPKLNSHISRAKKILHKLKRLSNKAGEK